MKTLVLSAIEGYLDMMPPRVSSSSILPDDVTQSLAGRLEVVRSYVQEDSESGGENSDESSVASLGGSEEYLPKERAYSVGCKPPLMSGQLHLRTGASRPPKAPGKTSEKSAEGSRQRHQDSSTGGGGGSGGLRPPRKISMPSRPDHFQRQSVEVAPLKCLTPEGLTTRKIMSSSDPDRADHTSADGTIRPRTSTLPWDLRRGAWNVCDGDPLRPRSSSGGNAASIRDAVRSRLVAGRQASSLGTPPSRLDSVHQVAQHGDVVCSAETQEVGEYVEMRCPASS